MGTETLKISLVQKILEVSDMSVLEKMNSILNSEEIIGYNAEGKAISKNQYIQEMDELNQQIKEGTAKFYTTDEVRKQIIDGNNLDS